MPNDGMVSMLDRWEQQGNPFAVTPRKKKVTENDGGPGSGNFNHGGRPGKVGGSTSGDKKASATNHKIVSISNPDSDSVKRAFASYDPFEIIYKYDPLFSQAEKDGDTEKLRKLRKQENDENQENLGKRLKSLGTYMEPGYYINAKDADNNRSEIFLRGTVNTEVGCYNMQPATSANSRDSIAASYLTDSWIRISESEVKQRILDESIKRNDDVTLGGVSNAEERAIKTYTYASAASSALRNGKTSEQSNAIQSVMDRTASPERTVYRGVSSDYARKLSALKVGDTTSDRGFASTSYEKDVAQKFSGDDGIVMKIHVPSGFGHSLSVGYLSDKLDEYEVLLNRNVQLKVKEKDASTITFEASWPSNNSDGGPGSGNFGHKGRPGKVGGAAGGKTTRTPETSSHGSSKNFRSLIPSDSYTNTTDYQNASKAFKSALKKRDEIYDKQNAVKKELESEIHPKPRSEWTEDDEIYDMLGDRPMVYTDKGKELKAQSDKLSKELSAADHEFTEAGDRLRDIKKKAHDEQIKSVSFDKPAKASSDDYEGFTTKTTGTGYDEYLNGKQSGGYIAEMSPAEYLKRCAYQVFENATIESTLAAINEKNVDEYAKKMESGEKFDMPYLNLKKGEQEGRHRAAAAMKAGIENIPVLVVGYKQNTDSADKRGSVGVLVIKDGRILCGIRSGNTAPGCICGPGGHIENGETPEQAAVRETQEEFGITPKDLVPIGNGPAESDTGYSPNLFLCTDYDGEPNCTSNEMSWAQFVDLDRFANNPPSMFQPFADSIICLLNAMSLNDHEDGGPGSGHFGHESEKGKRGGSIKSHVRLEGCSDSTKTLIDEALENPYGFGGVDTEARKQSIRSSLEKDGVKVTVDEDGLSMAFSSKFSYDDCVDANKAMNGYNMLGREEYIQLCKESDSEPILHETPEALRYVDKPDDGNMSVYRYFNSYNALNDDDIAKYSAFDHDQNPNGNEALTKASVSAIESLTPEQHKALVNYTQQFGPATYADVNRYLTCSDEEKAGYSDTVAKNAAAITAALDKEIGADCLVSRGQSDLIGIAPDKKLENYVKQISKCNFKNASKLKQALEGKVIQNDAVMSTSAGNSAGDYSACSVQLLLKTPAKAKAVDLSAISAYGTHSEIEKVLAAAMGHSLSYEHEIAFKPGMQYKIDSVDIGFRPASAGMKKPSAYVYITGTVLTDDERTDGVFFAGELDDHDV